MISCFLINISAQKTNDSIKVFTPDISFFITKKEENQIRRDAEKEKLFNPIFLDWVMKNKQLDTIFIPRNEIETLRENAKKYVSKISPELFSYHIDTLPKEEVIDVKKRKKQLIALLDVKKVNIKPEKLLKVKTPKPSNWYSPVKMQLQGTQNYVSENWYNGGESNITIIAFVDAKANYDNKKNIQWENNFQLKWGLNGSKSDTVHNVKWSEDLISLTSKLGIKAVKNWYYTASTDISVPLFNTYLPNSQERSTAPLSPIRFNFNVGMDYKVKKWLSIFMSPVS
ncbi:MAG: DUF3078 domain-containing protein, partial [Paludibacter sp.]|nr:DUF3078 domain-containing protein [Paludibacter sp.]